MQKLFASEIIVKIICQNKQKLCAMTTSALFHSCIHPIVMLRLLTFVCASNVPFFYKSVYLNKIAEFFSLLINYSWLPLTLTQTATEL